MNDAGNGLGWRVQWQDYRGWRTRDVRAPPPPIRYADFLDREAADRELRLQRAAGMTVCITPIYPPRSRKGRYPKLSPINWPVQHRALYAGSGK